MSRKQKPISCAACLAALALVLSACGSSSHSESTSAQSTSSQSTSTPTASATTTTTRTTSSGGGGTGKGKAEGKAGGKAPSAAPNLLQNAAYVDGTAGWRAYARSAKVASFSAASAGGNVRALALKATHTGGGQLGLAEILTVFAAKAGCRYTVAAPVQAKPGSRQREIEARIVWELPGAKSAVAAHVPRGSGRFVLRLTAPAPQRAKAGELLVGSILRPGDTTSFLLLPMTLTARCAK